MLPFAVPVQLTDAVIQDLNSRCVVLVLLALMHPPQGGQAASIG